MSKKYKLAALTSHPIQYQAPLFRKLAEHPEVDLTVYFCDDFGVKGEEFDPGFGKKIKWDIPLLEGYKYKFLRNLSPSPLKGFWGLINPSIIREIKKNRYDAIWIHGYMSLTNWFGFLGAWLNSTPIIFRGESHLLNKRQLWKRVIKYINLTMLFKRITAFLPIGKLNREYYKYYGVPENKMFFTPYAVDSEFFYAKYLELINKKDDFKKQVGLNPALPTILYASKMIIRKRTIDLLKAFRMISDKIDAQLLMVGDGEERPLLEKYVKDNNLKHVYFVGFKNQTKLPEYFIIADIFVLPSTDEPWGLVVNEAMCFHLPVIVSDMVGCGKDLLRHGENGFIFKTGDINELTECLLKLLQEPELREKMGERSLEIISKWSFEEDIEGILSALKFIKKMWML